MAKWVAGDVLDAALARIAGADRMVAVTGQPADYAAAVEGALASAVLAPGDFALSDAGAGRQVAIAAKPAVAVTGTGTADHVALLAEATSRLLYVTTCPDQALSAGETVSIGSWTVEIGGPV
jgi:hypothetical protein